MKKIIFLLLILFNLVFAQETIILQDDLQGSTIGVKVGGSITSDGYKPGIGFNHILYDVPVQVVEGYVEFQVKGFSKSLMQDPNGGDDADNGFIGMYDGRGSTEPIPYFNNFKYNFFRWNFHYRQGRSAVKAVIDCADPNAENLNATQAWHDCAQDGTCSDPREWYSEPTGSAYNFNADTWYTIRLTWLNKTFKVTINGTQVWASTPSPGPNDYAPIDFKIWLGGAPGYDDKYGNWVPGTTYRNFKLVSYSGGSTQTPPQITSSAVTTGIVGQLYSYDVNASGNPTPTYSLTTFPSGMTINSTSGLIQWTPSSTGNFNVTVKAANGVSPDASQSFTVAVEEDQTANCPPGIISYWKLDETAGNVYNDFAGGNDATSPNTPAPVTGKVNGGQQFNGTSNRISAQRISAYNFTTNGSFTYEAWMKHIIGDYTVNEILMGTKDNSTSLSCKLTVTPDISFVVRSKTGQSASVSGPTLYDNQWHHIVGVKDGVLNQLRIYVDGVLINTAPTAYTSGFDSPSAPFTIGWKDLTGDESYFRGSIDEVAIYGGVLDAAAILRHYNNGLQNLGYCEVIPSAPGNLIANKVSSSRIDLNWTDNSDNESGFKIERKTGSEGSWSQIADIGSNNETYQNSGLAPNTTYYFRIRAYNSDGNSGYSNEDSATTDNVIPSAPYSLKATAIDSTQINLSWKDNSNNEDGFKIERKTGSNGSWLQISDIGSNNEAYQNSYLIPNTAYYFRVRAYNSAGNSDYSNEDSATTDETVPAAASNLTANAVSSTQINLGWTDNSENEAGFKIERKKGADENWSQIVSVAGNVTSYQDTNLFYNTTYYYRLRAYNSAGNSEYSNETDATTDNIAPFAASDLTASVINSTLIRLTWSDNSDNEDGFIIERKTGSDGSWLQIAAVTVNDTVCHDTSLVPNSAYYYHVIAYNAVGNSDYSNEVYVIITGIKDLEFSDITPKDFILFDNYPNPFNPSTIIQFGIPEESIVSLKIYDIRGKEVSQVLNNETLPAGTFRYEFSANNLSSGIYFYVLVSNSNILNRQFKSVKKMLLLK